MVEYKELKLYVYVLDEIICECLYILLESEEVFFV